LKLLLGVSISDLTIGQQEMHPSGFFLGIQPSQEFQAGKVASFGFSFFSTKAKRLAAKNVYEMTVSCELTHKN